MEQVNKIKKFTIEQARLLSGLSQKKMAVLLGMSEKTYIKYEKYRSVFRMDTAALFIHHVNLTYDEVIFFNHDVQKICS